MNRGVPTARALRSTVSPSDDRPYALGPTATPRVTGAIRPKAVDALQQVLAGEHAVVWAYGALGPRLDEAGSARALELLRAHEHRRDAVRAQLVGAGVQPVVAEPAYDLPADPVDAATAAQLASLVEERLAAVYADLVAATGDSQLRTDGVTGLVDSAVRALSWAPVPTTFPGLPERTSDT